MSDKDPKHDLMFLSIDVPICADFLALEEILRGAKLSYDEAIAYLAKELSFATFRAKQIVDTIMGEPHPGVTNASS